MAADPDPPALPPAAPDPGVWPALRARLPRAFNVPAALRGARVVWLLGAAALALGVGGGVLVLAATSDRGQVRAEAVVPAAVRVITTTSAAPQLVIHVAGAVVNPGIYRVAPTARVADALAAAGGPRPQADLARLNLASPVADGMRVYVPLAGETPPAVVGPDSAGGSGGSAAAGTAGGGGGAASDPVDLNTATAEQLDALPGVGPATAAAIVRHRSAQPFTAIEDLLNVPGIGPAKLERLRAHVRV